jgi:hypothetical protein
MRQKFTMEAERNELKGYNRYVTGCMNETPPLSV